MMLRGTLAELGELRSLLMDKSTREQLMQTADDEVFDDAEQDHVGLLVANESGAVESDNNVVLIGVEATNSSSKRRRDGADDDEDEEDSSCYNTTEDILAFLPSIQCNCSSWDMKNVQGDLVVTSIRVLFIASTNSNSDDCNDIAIDGRCIALHALDSESLGEEQTDSLPHVYCQLSDPSCESNDVGGSTAIGFGASSNIMDENASECDEEAEGIEEDMSADNGVVELYFKPIICEHVSDKEQHAEVCQKLFNALTKLASLNPVDDSDCGGGLFNMLSLMAGMEEGNFGGNEESDDDEMVIRFGGSGSNNLVEDDGESAGAPENERQAMLDRLDNVLVVPPEYEIPSEDEGQFDDAEDDEDLL
jgi:hypothetical protein